MNLDDPAYRHVLGISSGTPLDNWYDLLGVRRFESNDRALEMAMLSRVGQVRRYQIGAYQQAALTLLSELSQAYVALTDAESREQYDATLRKPAVAIPTTLDAAWPEMGEGRSMRTPIPSRQPAPDTPAAPSAEACPKCGKPMPARIRNCYHCGAPRATATAPTAAAQAPATQLAGSDELLRQDLSPEQILGKLQRMRDLHRANRLGSSHWTPPADRDRIVVKPQSFCQNCRRPLIHRGDAYAMERSALCNSSDFVADFAKKMTALGKYHFTFPLGKSEIQQVRELIPGQHSHAVRLFCLSCFERFWNSPKID